MDVIKVLIENDADVNIKNKNGQTPLEIALEKPKGNLERFKSNHHENSIEIRNKHKISFFFIEYVYLWIATLLKIAEDKSKLLRNSKSTDFYFLQ